jgi:AcrR family transcriptional regulator
MAQSSHRLPGGERRQQILKCAARVFARSNYRKARVADIAAEAGVSEAMIYKHFPSKKAIFLEILHDMAQRVVSRLLGELDEEQDAVQVLRNVARTFYNLTVSDPEEVKIQVQAISEIDDPEVAGRLRQDHIGFVSFIRSIVERGMRQGTIRKDLDVETSVLLLGGVGMYIQLMKILSFEDWFTEESAVRMTDQVLDSMRS